MIILQERLFGKQHTNNKRQNFTSVIFQLPGTTQPFAQRANASKIGETAPLILTGGVLTKTEAPQSGDSDEFQ